MQVIYVKTIVEKIDEAILEARRNNKDVELIRLTRSEWQAFQDFINANRLYTRPLVTRGRSHCTFKGVRIEPENEEF